MIKQSVSKIMKKVFPYLLENQDALHVKILNFCLSPVRFVYYLLVNNPKLYLSTKLHNCVPDLLTCKMYMLRYKAVRKDIVPRSPLMEESIPNTEKSLNVAFFVSIPNLRLIRHAHTVKKFGGKVFLIYQPSVYTGIKIDLDIFDDILYINSAYMEMKKIKQFLAEKQVNVVHYISNYCVNHDILPLLYEANITVVGDAYDNVHASFERLPFNLLGKNLCYERLWFRNVDALCLRSPVLKDSRVRNIYVSGTPVINMTEVILSEHICNRAREDDAYIHIVTDMSFHHSDISKKQIEILIQHIMKVSNIVLHILRTPQDMENVYGAQVKMYGALSYIEYQKFIEKIDAYYMYDTTSSLISIGYHKDGGYKFAVANKSFDYLEKNKIVIMPDFEEHMTSLLKPTNRLISFSEGEELTLEFWQSLPTKIYELSKEPANIYKLTDEYFAPKLDAFYRRAIIHAVKKRGILK